MQHRKPVRASIQWIMLKLDIPAPPFVQHCLGILVLMIGLGILLWLGQPVILAML
ncbi:hypothetical protein HNO53_20775 [Billgrantia antri]|uniref:Uncharacterized protein n=1 Tax=Halomonas sulfidivorans TaxID=2733488 RepID=A0ABX7WKP3_9GAMM|nr:hypothetical protein [Halomonas sulfidivorans]QTP60933.1 hypothetical protein HNO53_20775 [Halomonas sulfidivorans]